MKVIYTTILGFLLLLSTRIASAQESDTAIATRNALQQAEKLVRANFYQDWKSYADLTIHSAIKYYGGAEQFREHTVACYFRNEPKLEEKPETIRVIEMRNDIDQWQCVIEKVRNTFQNDKKAVVTTYLVGQSLDGGQTWKFIDVSHNALENLAIIFPAIFTDLTIPLAKTVFPDEIAAQPAEETAPRPVAKKKTTSKAR